jgi:hypothetical protein
MRLIALWLIPVALAIERVDQCVAPAGCPSSVLTVTRSTSASLIERGFPGRSSSWQPIKTPPREPAPPRTDRVCVTAQSGAISLLDRPSATAETQPDSETPTPASSSDARPTDPPPPAPAR